MRVREGLIKSKTVTPHTLNNVVQGAKIATDDACAFRKLNSRGFRHASINHRAGEYICGPVHMNTIEDFRAWMKRPIYGTHIWVSAKNLPKYLGEMEYRFNLRKSPELMFDLLVLAFAPSQTRVDQIERMHRTAHRI